MKLWVMTYANPVAIVVVYATDVEHARRLATEELADKAPGITPTEAAAVPFDQPPNGGVLFSQLTRIE